MPVNECQPVNAVLLFRGLTEKFCRKVVGVLFLGQLGLNRKTMRGKRDGRQAGPPKKKPKRSKGFWAQRQTQQIPEIPPDSDEESSEISDEEEVAVSNYDTLVTQFSSGTGAIVDEEDAEIDSEDSSDDNEDDNEDNNDVNENEEDDEIESAEEAEEEEEEEEEEQEEQETSNNDETEEKDQTSDEVGSTLSTAEEEITETVESDDEANDDGGTGLEWQIGAPKDPFVAKYSTEISQVVKRALEENKVKIETVHWPELGQMSIQRLDLPDDTASDMKVKPLLSLDDEEVEENTKEFAIKVKEQITQAKRSVNRLQSLGTEFIKAQLLRNMADANKEILSAKQPCSKVKSFTPMQSEMFAILNSYKDLNVNERTFENGEEFRMVYCLHALNHVLKTRTRIINNNERLAAVKSNKKKLAINARDQGLCRPKVVIVVPFKECVRKIVDFMETLLFGLNDKGNVANKKKFSDEYGHREEVQKGNKSDDFYRMFAGNTDDGFRLGLGVTKKTLKLYTDFYSSDIIIASPLGLRMVIGTDEDVKRDYDFLTSIELLVMDQVDVFAMQNWEHVTGIFNHLHLQPAKSHGVDFSRVRMWTLNQLSVHYRQTLLISSVQMPEVNALFNKQCQNFYGKVKVINPVTKGSICRVLTSAVPIIFRKFESTTVVSSVQERFNFFTKKIMPDFSQDLMYHTLIFVPSYFDYVQLRNWFDKKSYLDYAEICEYTKYKKMAAARDRFFHGEHHFLLYTERAHFYKRFAIKGIRHLVFYQIPQYPEFFSEMVNLMQSSYQNPKGGSDGNMSCTIIYNKYDIHRLTPVVGTERARTMLKSDKNTHMFAAGKS